MTRIAFKYGIFMFAAFTLYFLVMYMLGLGHRSEFRAVNLFFQLGFLYLAIREYRLIHPESAENYASGVSTGLAASMVGVIAFGVFMAVFLGTHPGLMEQVRGTMSIGENLNPVATAAFISVEGVCVGLIGSYILVRVVDGPKERRIEREEQR